MKKNAYYVLLAMLLGLFLGFMGGMETAENITLPLVGTLLCLAGFWLVGNMDCEWEEEDEDE